MAKGSPTHHSPSPDETSDASSSSETYNAPTFVVLTLIGNVFLAVSAGVLTVGITIINTKHGMDSITTISNCILLFILGVSCAFCSIVMDYFARILYAREAKSGKYLLGSAEAVDCAAVAMALASVAVLVWGGYIVVSASQGVLASQGLNGMT
jgi:hypothetical protein